jgi:chromatin modification-related protein VID21
MPNRDRLFDESNLPTRRQLRSDTSKQKSPIRKPTPESRPTDASRKAAKLQRDGSRSRKSRAATPSARSDGGKSATENENGIVGVTVHEIPMERSSSRGSQTDLPTEASAVLDEIVEETFENANQPEPSMPNSVVPPKDLESDRIRTVLESRPNSPGVDPRKAMPISAEDAAQLPDPLVDGLGSHDIPHKATTAHLPPQDVQERKLRQSEKAREQNQAGNLSINLPPRDGGRHAEPLSSPGSTVDAQSATTPAMHDASTDTSPENESRYDADRMDTKDDDPPTPPELKRTPDEVAEKDEHDRILKAQMDIARAEILRRSPNAGEDQPMEDEAAGIPDVGVDDSRTVKEPSVNGEQENSDQLTKEASEIVEDAAEDDDEVVAVPTPGDQSGLGASNAGPKEPEKQPEIADSEAEDTPPVDAMDVDATTVKDSFESSTALESGPATSPVEPEVTDSATKPTGEPKKTFATPAASTPRRTPPIPATVPPTLERMTTRVASGAMRHKSVSEILGEIPKPNTSSSSERSATKVDSDSAGNSHSPSRSTTPQSPGTRVRSLVEKAKEKERSKLSTVIFPGRPPKPASNDNAVLQNGQPSETSKEDYFMPLFLATASTDKRGVPSLDNLLAAAHKTITTSNAYVPIEENQTAKVLKRIYNLQSSNKWSLRQPKRAPEPVRPTTHWDVLLQEAKWMRTDFREERKWKMTTARNLAFACAEWNESSPEDRKLLQVKARPPKPAEAVESRDTEIGEGSSQAGTHPTPDLVNSGDDSPMDDDEEEPRLDLTETVSPTAIFALQDDDVVFGLRRSPTTDKLLNELPMYGAPLQVPQSDLPTSSLDPDRFWRRPALPLSKYIEGRMELKMEPPPRKRSRFEYEQEDDDEDHVVFGEQGAKRPKLAPEKTDVALFNPEHKHIRDRIHSSHQFRPPSEFPMPLQTFFECRVASQWTYEEDNELKNHVRDYQYNWSLISSLLTSKSLFTSGAERRTPWECFERWIHLEGLPADMQKTHYFRAYTNRIEQANRLVMAQAAQAQAQPNANGQVQPPPRRRPTTSFRVERRRNQKHLTLVDAMRKLAKKRETSLQKQQHAAGMAAMRKANEAAPNPAVANHNLARTPQAFSRMRQEQDEKMRERMIHLQQRQEQQRRVFLSNLHRFIAS